MRYESLQAKLPLAPAGEMVLGLASMKQLMAHFNHPENQLPTIHIAGTNGKGSTAKMVATILQAAGYKVGLFTSPSLVDFNERIQINGQQITDTQLMAQVDRMTAALGPDEYYTEFEVFTGLAWLTFEANQVDFVVLEVGLGGRLDATNIINQPLVTAITKIALDHQKILGDTLAEIAGEKAGILKAGVPLVLYPQVDEAKRVITQQADRLQVPIHEVKPGDIESLSIDAHGLQSFKYKGRKYTLNLQAPYQVNNAALAIEIIQVLKAQGIVISDQAIEKGLATVTWPARFEIVASEPTIIIDGSHNMDGIVSLKEAILTHYPASKVGKRVAIMGMLADKDVAHVVEAIAPIFQKIITVTPHSNRALAGDQLAAMIKATGTAVEFADSDQAALEIAEGYLKEEDLLCIFGSFYFVGYLRSIIKNRL